MSWHFLHLRGKTRLMLQDVSILSVMQGKVVKGDPMSGFCERLRNFRKDAGLTQGELASRIGVAKSTFVAWENGSTQPPLRLAPLLRGAFGPEHLLAIQKLVGIDGADDPNLVQDFDQLAEISEIVVKHGRTLGKEIPLGSALTLANMVLSRGPAERTAALSTALGAMRIGAR